MAKLRNLKIENEALAGINAADAAEISVEITSTETAENNKFTPNADVTLTANVTAGGSSSGGSNEPMVGNRTLSEHLRMRLLGYI